MTSVVTKEQKRTAAVLGIPVSFVCEQRPEIRLELEETDFRQDRCCAISDEELDELLLEHWNLLTTAERAEWWSKTTWDGSYGITAEIKWDSTPAESTRGSDTEKKWRMPYALEHAKDRGEVERVEELLDSGPYSESFKKKIRKNTWIARKRAQNAATKRAEEWKNYQITLPPPPPITTKWPPPSG